METPATSSPADRSSKTLFEIMAEERDAKRRRIKYKSVHTNRKSQTEILRQVIDNQMEMYVDYLKLSSLQDVKKEDDEDDQQLKGKSSDGETMSMSSSKRSDDGSSSVTSRKSLRDTHHVRKKSKYDVKMSKLDEKLSKYDEKISKYDEKLNKYQRQHVYEEESHGSRHYTISSSSSNSHRQRIPQSVEHKYSRGGNEYKHKHYRSRSQRPYHNHNKR